MLPAATTVLGGQWDLPLSAMDPLLLGSLLSELSLKRLALHVCFSLSESEMSWRADLSPA